MNQSLVQPSRGILNPKRAAAHFQIRRFLPAEDLAFWIERYWILRWDLRGCPPHSQSTLPYPCINVAVEWGRSGVFGITTGRFTRVIEGVGWVFGIKFRPGAFYPFVRVPVSAFTDRTVCLSTLFGAAGAAYEAAVLGLDDDAAWIAQAEAFLRPRLPAPDPQVTLLNTLIESIATDRLITKVDTLVGRTHHSKRSLQRLFQQYVGVSPKWVIQRYRLHEAAALLETGAKVDCAHLAADLGYCDQAHFIKDFKLIVGKTPLEYAREVSS